MFLKTSTISFSFILLCIVVLTSGFDSQAQEKGTSEGFIKTSDGSRLYYRIDGSKGAPVVVVNGGPGFSMSYIRPDLLRLSQSRTLLFYDQRGTGRSTLTSDPNLITISKYIDDLDTLRRHFKLEKLTLLGHSWGVGLAALYAIKYPERVKELLLVGPMEIRSNPYTAQFESNMTSWMDEDTKKRFSELIVLKNKTNDVTWCEDLFSIVLPAYFSNPINTDKMKGGFCNDSPEAILNGQKIEPILIKELGDWDWRNSLKNVNARTLVVCGTDDIIPLDSAREWAESLPIARLIVIPKSGHMLYVEQPDAFFKAVKEFLHGDWPGNSEAVRKTLMK